MSWMPIAWSMMGAASITLGMVHLTIWVRRTAQRAHLWFFVLALALSAIAVCEVLMMKAGTLDAFAAVQRWVHVPIFLIFVGLVGFVHEFFGTGRLWRAYCNRPGRNTVACRATTVVCAGPLTLLAQAGAIALTIPAPRPLRESC